MTTLKHKSIFGFVASHGGGTADYTSKANMIEDMTTALDAGGVVAAYEYIFDTVKATEVVDITNEMREKCAIKCLSGYEKKDHWEDDHFALRFSRWVEDTDAYDALSNGPNTDASNASDAAYDARDQKDL